MGKRAPLFRAVASFVAVYGPLASNLPSDGVGGEGPGLDDPLELLEPRGPDGPVHLRARGRGRTDPPAPSIHPTTQRAEAPAAGVGKPRSNESNKRS